ncbi:tyrosine--tRNA ligase [Candidatus Micrarchaeota archaeon]|nr:tyrosine--tRNA ligase [Candidatus Micrarchaeota archaeon]
MDVQTKLDLALRAPTCEAVTQEELRQLFETKASPSHYIGFEASGQLHLGYLLLAMKVNDFAAAGVKTQVYLADWHSFINKKMGGDWNAIHQVCDYFKEAYGFLCPKTKIVLGSDLYHNNDEYWMDVMRFSSHTTIARVTRCLSIMGRSEKDALSTAQFFYPPMQAVDIKHLDVDIAHAGLDQRKVHMLAREVYPKLGWKNFISIHHSLLPALAEPEKSIGGGGDNADKLEQVIAAKMSKSKPDSAIFIHDSREEIARKVNKAYCPPVAEGNPVLEYAKHLLFREPKFVLEISRPEKYGGDASFDSFEKLEAAYLDKKLHAGDLKSGVAAALDDLVKPVRAHFEKNSKHLEFLRKAVV